jgi:hypothetical protein
MTHKSEDYKISAFVKRQWLGKIPNHLEAVMF